MSGIAAPGLVDCRVYWGSHGCDLPRDHDGACVCACAFDTYEAAVRNVGAPPYYGDGRTFFYGEDAAARGLPVLPVS